MRITSFQDGSMKNFVAKMKVSDNLDPSPTRSYLGFTSSENAGTVQNVFIIGKDVSGQFQNSKTGLQRTYTLNFAATDDAGNVGTCLMKIVVK